MSLFKIISQDGWNHTGKYLGEDLSFTFNKQNSEERQSYILRKDTIVDIDTNACWLLLLVGSVYELSGSWMNFTKKSTPELVLCVTSIKSV